MRTMALTMVSALALITGTSGAAQTLATPATRALQQRAAELTPAEEAAEAVEDAAARRGFIARIPDGVIRNAAGGVVWDWRPYDFLNAERAPDTVHPRLWRQARRNAQHGLYEVVPGAIWQVRGYDIAVMTIIRGDSGWIVVDPLTNEEAARAAMQLVNQHLGERPVRAVIFSHSHGDHFGGVGGVVTAEQVARDHIRIIAPHNFVAEAVSENVMAGAAMFRRVTYMFGARLPAGVDGQVDTGLGPRTGQGTVGFMRPTETVGPEGGERVIDGVPFQFMDAAGTEAPAELLFYLPRWRALHSTEVATKTLHNLLTLRGAQVRDALHWSQVIDAMLTRWGAESEVQLASHGWPTFGADAVRDFLAAQRDIYRYIHDRALGAANAGATMQELPDLVEGQEGVLHPSARGYYGTINHNAKAVYQRYFGWWDGVPAHYDPLPPEAAGRGYVALAGGAERLLAAGRAAHGEGNYRWAAELLNHLVFAEPDNAPARAALADAYEQLGFQAESGAWRNYYLAAVATLRGTERAGGLQSAGQSPSFLAALATLDVLNLMATTYVPNPADPTVRHFAIRFSDTGEDHSVEVRPSVEIPRVGAAQGPVTATITLPRMAFLGLVAGRVSVPALVESGALQVDGDRAALAGWLARHRRGEAEFAVVTP